MPPTDATYASTSPAILQRLEPPRTERQDLVIIGGGPSGVTAAMRLLSGLEEDKHGQRFSGLSSASLLAGGDSLAFPSVNGDWARFFTLFGSETIRRGETLARARQFTKRHFSERGFSFRENTFARKVLQTPDREFTISASVGGETLQLTAQKVIVAFGHTLKERPNELHEYVFRGTLDLCTRLQNHQEAGDPSHCVDHLLSRFTRTANGVVRVGMIGLGSTFLEAIKIFHALLIPPQSDRDVFRTAVSHTPVEFVLFDSRLGGSSSPVHNMMEFIQAFHNHIKEEDQPGNLLTREGVQTYKRAEMGRFQELVNTSQITVIPERFDWSSIKIVDRMLHCHSQSNRVDQLSCIVDCSPFQTGISRQQRAILQEIPGLTFHATSDETFETELSDKSMADRIALVGAAFAPKDKWGLGTMNQNGIEAIESLFPRCPRPMAT